MPYKAGEICHIILCVSASNSHMFPWQVQVPDTAQANFLLAGSLRVHHGTARTGMDPCPSSARDSDCPCWGPLPVLRWHPAPSLGSWQRWWDGWKRTEGDCRWNAMVRGWMTELEASWQPWAHATAGACKRMSGILFPGLWQCCCVFLAQHRPQRPLDLNCGELLLFSSLNL